MMMIMKERTMMIDADDDGLKTHLFAGQPDAPVLYWQNQEPRHPWFQTRHSTIDQTRITATFGQCP
jgi:hypothetical protein